MELQEAISLSDAVTTVKSLTGLSHLRLATGKDKNLDTPIKTVALCAGSGGSVLKDVVADLYLTGILTKFLSILYSYKLNPLRGMFEVA